MEPDTFAHFFFGIWIAWCFACMVLAVLIWEKRRKDGRSSVRDILGVICCVIGLLAGLFFSSPYWA
jgi:hypothetical protein